MNFEGRKPFEMIDDDSEEEPKEMYEVSPSLREAKSRLKNLEKLMASLT